MRILGARKFFGGKIRPHWTEVTIAKKYKTFDMVVLEVDAVCWNNLYIGLWKIFKQA